MHRACLQRGAAFAGWQACVHAAGLQACCRRPGLQPSTITPLTTPLHAPPAAPSLCGLCRHRVRLQLPAHVYRRLRHEPHDAQRAGDALGLGPPARAGLQGGTGCCAQGPRSGASPASCALACLRRAARVCAAPAWRLLGSSPCPGSSLQMVVVLFSSCADQSPKVQTVCVMLLMVYAWWSLFSGAGYYGAVGVG